MPHASLLFANPYDYLHPVADPLKFAGRFNEIEDLDYQFERARTSQPQYTNIAYIGQRGVGKTSLLHKVHSIAQSKAYLVARLSLTSTLVENTQEFFKGLFDAVLFQASEKGLFKTKGPSIYQAYGHAMTNLEFNAAGSGFPSLPLDFVDDYIKWRKEGSPKSSVSIPHIQHDFASIRQEAEKYDIKAVVIIIDDFHLMLNNRNGLLHFLSTLLADPAIGWIFILAGDDRTLELFSREGAFQGQFHLVKLENFRDIRETENCILLSLSQQDTELFDYTCINEIHQWTNGNPYEIKLVCFHMYRLYQSGLVDQITLSSEVLDAVLAEFEKTGIGTGDIISAIKVLTTNQLQALSFILPYEGWTIEQISRYNVFLQLCEGNTKFDAKNELVIRQTRLERAMASIEKAKLMNTEDGKIFFGGNRFERLYLKYYATSKKVYWQAVNKPYHEAVADKFSSLIRDPEISLGWNRRILDTEKEANLRDIVLNWKASLENGTWDIEEDESEFLVVEDRGFVRGFAYNLRKPPFLPELLRNPRSMRKMIALKFRLDSVGDNSRYISLFVVGLNQDLEKKKNGLQRVFLELGEHLRNIGISVDEIDFFRLKFRPLKQIAKDAVNERNLSLMREIQLSYLFAGRDAFIAGHHLRAAEIFGTHDIMPLEDQDTLLRALAHNNRGFVLGALGNYGEALEEWQQALKLYPPRWRMEAMTYQDLSYVYFKLGDLPKAIEYALKAIQADGHLNAKVGSLFIKFCETKFQHPAQWKWEYVLYPRVATASYCNLVAIYATLGDFDKAQQYAKSAERGAWDQPAAFRCQGWLALKMDDWATAVDRFLQALSLEPDNVIIKEEVAIAASAKNEKQE